MIAYPKYHRGFSLLELLLAITVIAGLLTGIANVLSNSLRDTVDRNVAREMQQLQSAAQEFVRLNMNQIIANNVPFVGNIAEIDIDDLIDNGFLPVGYGSENSYRQNLRVFVRYLADDTINGNVIEVLSVSEGPRIPDSRLFKAVTNGEKNLGVISNLNISATCCNGNIQSVSGAWSVPFADFPGLDAPNDDGGYIAAYGLASNNDRLANDYLFRDRVNNNPVRNRMETDLDLNGNEIINAGIIIVDNMAVGGNATFNGIDIDGTASPYVLSVRDNFSGGNVSINSGGDARKGNVTVNGDDTDVSDFTVTGNMVVTNSTSATVIAPSNITVGGVSRFRSVNNNNTNISADAINTQTVRFDGNLNTQSLQATNTLNLGTVTTLKGTAASVNITNDAGTGLLDVDSDVLAESNVLVRGNGSAQIVNATDELTISDFNSCNIDCD